MKKIIDRFFINPNIHFVDYENNHYYDYNQLCREIDAFKNLLQSHANGENTESIVIALQPSLQQTACIFACFELGITICIVDYERPDHFKQYDYMDPKTELLTPIDIFITNNTYSDPKKEFFMKTCKKTIAVDIINLDYSKNTLIYAQSNTSIMRCTSSGTTNTPKIIEHTHEFMLNLAIRNSIFYFGNCAILYNLNHGSSFATYFLPVLNSRETKKVYNLSTQGRNLKYIPKLIELFEELDHLMLSYPKDVTKALPYSHQKLHIYTLSTILSKWKKYSDKVADVISIFGCNETSGPTLINRLKSKCFDPSHYYTIDNFFGISIIDKNLHVTVPFYKNATINTKDLFVFQEPNTFRFLGRNDLIKINGLPIDKSEQQKIVQKFFGQDFDIIYDIQENQIYLALWKPYKDTKYKVKQCSKELKAISGRRHNISKHAVLDKSEFLSGIKIDNELLRHYFRKFK